MLNANANARRYGNIAVFAGQSNMGSTGTTSTAPPTNTNITTLGNEAQIWSWSAHSFSKYVAQTNSECNINTSAHSPQFWGPEAGFARDWTKNNPGQTLFMVKGAESGTQLASTGNATNDWSTSSTGEYFDLLTAEINLAKTAVTRMGLIPRVIAICWGQGETDATDVTNAGNYATNLTTFREAALRKWGDVYTKFIIMRISNSTAWTQRATVRSAQAGVAAAFPQNTFLIDTDLFTLNGDNQHYAATEVSALGSMFYEALAWPVYDTATAAAVTIGTLNQYTDATDISTHEPVYTFADCDLGTAALNRRVLVFVNIRASATPQSVVIAGRRATLVDSSVVSTNGTWAYIAEIPDQIKVGDVKVYFTSGSGIARCGIGVISLYGTSALAASASLKVTTGDPASGSLTIPANGCAVACGFGTFSSAPNGAITWTGITKRGVDTNIESFVMQGFASDTYVGGGATTITADWAAAAAAGCQLMALTWGP